MFFIDLADMVEQQRQWQVNQFIQNDRVELRRLSGLMPGFNQLQFYFQLIDQIQGVEKTPVIGGNTHGGKKTSFDRTGASTTYQDEVAGLRHKTGSD